MYIRKEIWILEGRWVAERCLNLFLNVGNFILVPVWGNYTTLLLGFWGHRWADVRSGCRNWCPQSRFYSSYLVKGMKRQHLEFGSWVCWCVYLYNTHDGIWKAGEWCNVSHRLLEKRGCGVPKVCPYSLNCLITCSHWRPLTSLMFFTSGAFPRTCLAFSIVFLALEMNFLTLLSWQM